jgi:hypothetical protein
MAYNSYFVDQHNGQIILKLHDWVQIQKKFQNIVSLVVIHVTDMHWTQGLTQKKVQWDPNKFPNKNDFFRLKKSRKDD